MSKFISMLLLFVVLLFTGCKDQGVKASACDETSSRLVARAYVLSIPMMYRENELIPLMESNPGYFTEGGRAIQCMQSLGNALVQGGLEQYSQLDDYSATERFGAQMPGELAHLPGKVDDSLRSYSSDMFSMGQEFLWLSRVLPPAAQGDYTPYNTPGTESRRMAAQVMPILQMLCQMEPDMCQMMQSMWLEMSPVLEQQIYTLAIQLGS